MDGYKFHKQIDGVNFFAPSKTKHKKYDAYVGTKRIPFGDNRYEHFHDKIGYYSSLNHGDEKRRQSYAARHFEDNLNSYSPGYFSMYYLW